MEALTEMSGIKFQGDDEIRRSPSRSCQGFSTKYHQNDSSCKDQDTYRRKLIMTNEADLHWRDPVTGKLFSVDKRSGNSEEIGVSTSRGIQPMELKRYRHLSKYNDRCLSTSSILNRGDRTTWKTEISTLLDEWKNPVFHAPEICLPFIFKQGNDISSAGHQHIGHRCPHFDLATATIGPQIETRTCHITKEALAAAEVIGQVSRQFILVNVRASRPPGRDPSGFTPASRLIIIDQHAADERCIYEDLLKSMFNIAHCSNRGQGKGKSDSKARKHITVATTSLKDSLHFEMTKEEMQVLQAQASYLERWGIAIEWRRPAPTSTVHDPNTLAVHRLPTVVAERCIAEPNVLLCLLRSVIEGIKSGHIFGKDVNDGHGSGSLERWKPGWMRGMWSCPPALLELVRSRACRCAVMFNDVLNMNECKHLVDRLGKCMFPFQCAHGRPTLAPIIDVG